MRDFYWDARHGRPGLGRDPRPVRHAAAPADQPRRPRRPDRPGLRRGQHQPHLRLRRRPRRAVPRVATGLLGADLVREGEAYRMVRILPRRPGRPGALAAGRAGRRGRRGRLHPGRQRPPVKDAPNLHALLADLAGKQVLLTVADDRGGQEPPRRAGDPPGRRGRPALRRLGARATASTWPRRPAARSATSTSRTWAPRPGGVQHLVLPAARQGGHGRRHALERRRLRLARCSSSGCGGRCSPSTARAAARRAPTPTARSTARSWC